MDPTVDALNRAWLAFLDRSATTGAPPVIPATPAAISDPNSSTSNSDDIVRNSKNEKQRGQRGEMNKKFAELQELLRKDFNGMSQAKILEVAIETVVEIKSESWRGRDRLQGINEAMENIKRLTLSRMGSSKSTDDNHINNFEEFFKLFREVFNPSSSTTASAVNEIGNHTYKTKKEKMNHKAKLSRDKLADRFGLLKQFVVENKLLPSETVRINKLLILGTIIDYIKKNPAVHMPQPDHAQFLIGFEQGKSLTRKVATEYFKSHAHLRAEINAYHDLLDYHFGPLDPSIQTSDIHFDQVALQRFESRYQISVISCSPSNPARNPGSIFRPWE